MEAVMKFAILALILLFPCNLVYAMNGSAHVECVNGDHVVTVGGWYFEEFDPVITGLVFRRETIGLCEPDVMLPETPLPFETEFDPYGYGNYSASMTVTPTESDVTYRYVPFGVRTDGTLEPMFANCDADYRSYALAGCADAPIQRGRVEITPNCMMGDLCINIVPCSADCWSEYFFDFMSFEMFEELAGEPVGGLMGQVVDLYGTRTYCTMPGGNYYDITRIERAPDGACGPVPVEPSSWGSFKSRYR
jgi:hypothetical protein